jgi:hypothetical protein
LDLKITAVRLKSLLKVLNSKSHRTDGFLFWTVCFLTAKAEADKRFNCIPFLMLV